MIDGGSASADDLFQLIHKRWPFRSGADEAGRAGGWREGGSSAEHVRRACVRHLLPFIHASSFSLALRDWYICSTGATTLVTEARCSFTQASSHFCSKGIIGLGETIFCLSKFHHKSRMVSTILFTLIRVNVYYQGQNNNNLALHYLVQTCLCGIQSLGCCCFYIQTQ